MKRAGARFLAMEKQGMFIRRIGGSAHSGKDDGQYHACQMRASGDGKPEIPPVKIICENGVMLSEPRIVQPQPMTPKHL